MQYPRNTSIKLRYKPDYDICETVRKALKLCYDAECWKMEDTTKGYMKISVKLTEEDDRLIHDMMQKSGKKQSEIIRIALQYYNITRKPLSQAKVYHITL
jgi:hypothetical protein